MAAVRAVWVRQPVAHGPFDAHRRTRRSVPRGVDAAQRPGDPGAQSAHRRTGVQQYVPASIGAGEAAVTVDHISNGRLELGIGAGWFKLEHEMFGLEFPETGELVDRYAESLDLLDRFLRNDVTTFEGEYYTLKDAPNRPRPVQQPRIPFMVGAHGPRMIRLAATYADSWNTRGTPQDVRERNNLMDDACAAIGRNPRDIKRSLLYVIAQMTDENPWASVDAFEDFVGRFSEAGIEEFIFQPPDPYRDDIIETVAHAVIPRLRQS